MFFEETKTGIPKHREGFKPLPPPEPAKPLSFELVRKSFKPYHSTFARFLRDLLSKRDDAEQALARLDEVLQRYWVGATKGGRICYWMIDINGKCRDGKFMAYKPDGHRDHNQHPSWARNTVIRNLFESKRITLEQKEKLLDQQVMRPYFGMHLLSDPKLKGKAVALVEGEKSCLIASIAYPDFIWIACGMNTFNVARLLPILQQRRELLIFPDVDQIDRWVKLTEDLKYPKAYCMDKFIRMRRKSEKDDVGDIFLRELELGEMHLVGIGDPRDRIKRPENSQAENFRTMAGMSHNLLKSLNGPAEDEARQRLMEVEIVEKALGYEEPNEALRLLFFKLDLQIRMDEVIDEPDYIGF